MSLIERIAVEVNPKIEYRVGKQAGEAWTTWINWKETMQYRFNKGYALHERCYA